MPGHNSIAVRNINMDGSCILQDGREMQLVVAGNGALGVRPVTRQDQLSGIDQESSGVDAGHFDTSSLDQT